MSRVPTHRVVALLATPLLAVVTLVSCASPPQQEAAGTLPFDLDLAALRDSPRKVFAHYMPSMPLSFDNKDKASDYWTRNYINPDGESGKHAAYGGFTRDAPLARGVKSGNYQLLNMEDEVRQAIAAGIDGFAIDLLTLQNGNNNYTNTTLLMQAAENVDPGFKILLIPDMTTSTGEMSQSVLAGWLAGLAQSPAAFRLKDGRLVISPFKAELKTASWYKTLIDVMKSAHGINVAFVPIFLDERSQIDSFAPISYGMSVWGNRNPNGNDSSDNGNWDQRAEAVKAAGSGWMQSISFQDERPRHGIFDEAVNTLNLRTTWDLARTTEAEWVQMVTWNDYAEGTQMAPSDFHGWTPLDINAYYLSWYKTGRAPTINRDTVFVTHRPQLLSALPSYPQTELMDLRGGSNPARDTVEALTFLTAPSTVALTTGGVTTVCNVPAGVGSCTAPAGVGTVTAKVTRNGATTAIVTSPHEVTDKPYTQDFQYAAASSGREGGVDPGPGPTVTPTPTPPAGSTVKLAPVADTYANPHAVSENYGTSSSLASSGGGGYTSYLRFAVPAAPAGTTLSSATLSVRTNDLDVAGSAQPHTVRVASNDWSESTLNWSNRPSTSSTVLGTLQGATAKNTRYTTSLSVSAVAALAGTQSTMSVTNTGTSTDDLWFWSANHPDTTYRPQLTLTYTPTPTPPAGSTVKLAPVADTYANPHAVSENYGTSSSLASSGGGGYTSYLRFAVPAAPAGTTLSSATLSVRTNDLDVAGSAQPHTVRVASNDWSESTLNWSNRPSTSSTVLGTLQGATAKNTRYTTSLSVSAVAALAGTQSTMSVTNTGTSTDDLWFWSANHPDTTYRPQLTLTYTPTPTPPAGSTVKLAPVADTYANPHAVSENYGTSSSLASSGGGGYTSYLRFAVPAAPAGTTLSSATLSVRTNDLDVAGSAQPHTVRVASNDWSESTLNWSNRPSTSSTVLGTLQGATAKNTRYTTSLSVSAVAALAGTQSTMSVTNTGTSTDDLWFWSANHPDTTYRPQLTLTYTPTP